MIQFYLERKLHFTDIVRGLTSYKITRSEYSLRWLINHTPLVGISPCAKPCSALMINRQHNVWCEYVLKTRMHSSRMHTGRSLGLSALGGLPGPGGCVVPGGVPGPEGGGLVLGGWYLSMQ